MSELDSLLGGVSKLDNMGDNYYVIKTWKFRGEKLYEISGMTAEMEDWIAENIKDTAMIAEHSRSIIVDEKDFTIITLKWGK